MASCTAALRSGSRALLGQKASTLCGSFRPWGAALACGGSNFRGTSLAARAAARRATLTRHSRSALQQLLSVRAMSSASEESSMPRPRSRVALMIIGNEILSGSIQDTNTRWLAKTMYNRGVDLVRVEMLPDDIDDIVSTVHSLKARVGEDGAIITSGGIGPTHDDLTYEAIAKATGTSLAVHAATVERMRAHYGAQGKELNEARLRMATLPEGAEVLVTEGLWVPLVNINEVYILPGIPRLFQAMLGAHLSRFRGESIHSEAMYTRLGEGDLAKALAEIAAKHPDVNIGSYPNVNSDKSDFVTKLNFESRSLAAMRTAAKEAEVAFQCYTEP